MKLFTVIFGTVLCAALYHQVLGDGVTKCYTCDPIKDKECENPKETKCDETDGADVNTTWACLTASGTLYNTTVLAFKQCIDSSLADQICKTIQIAMLDSSCSYCTEDLCNFDNGVTKCYTCDATDKKCETAKETKCDEIDGAVANTIWACMTTTVSADDDTVTVKQCKPKDVAEETCKIFNSTLPDGIVGSCTVCNEDLCNSDVGVTKCYTCTGKCDEPKETNCDGTAGAIPNTAWACLTATATSDKTTATVKECIPNSIAEQTCKTFNNSIPEGTVVSCSYCTEDLCNSDNGNSDNGVTKCYTCDATDIKCENPKETKCDDTAGAVADTTWACLTTTLSTGDVTAIAKKCEPKNVAEETCKIFNGTLPDGVEGSCTVCNEDLCNADDGATKCYTCTGKCDEPIETNCDDTAGAIPNTRWACLTASTISGSTTATVKECIPSSIAEQTCKVFNNSVPEDIRASCSYCTQDLCNSDIRVTKCYTCDTTDLKCENQKETNCDDTDGATDNTWWACMTVTVVTSDDVTLTNKLCAPKYLAETACKEFDDALPDGDEGSCTVCNEDLCNFDN